MQKENSKDGLKREVSLGVAILFVIGSTIGLGIFMTPQNLAKSSTPAISIVAWIITALGSIMIALSFTNMASKVPKTGGCVVYTKAAFGELPAFLVDWIYWMGQATGGAVFFQQCL